MEKLTKGVVDCSTGISEVIELSSEEVSDLEALQAQANADRIAKEAEEERISLIKQSARAKLVAGQPLTEEEASLLII